MKEKLELLSTDQCEIGMEVQLVKPDPYYAINEKNPVKGSQYECTGVIYDLGSGFISVKWKNGSTNTYKKDELSSVKSIRYRSIW